MREQQREAAEQRRAAEQALADLFARQKANPAPVDRDATYDSILAQMAAMEEEHLFARAAATSKAHKLRGILARDTVRWRWRQRREGADKRARACGAVL